MESFHKPGKIKKHCQNKVKLLIRFLNCRVNAKMSGDLAHSLDGAVRTKDVLTDDETTFDSLLLPNRIFEGLRKNGFRKPSPIQLKAIPVGRCGFDIIVKSKSGTGKTIVFAVVALETIDTAKNYPSVLILCPTREIAVQVQEVIQSVGCCMEGLKVESFIGGTPLNEDKEKCNSCHVVVGTPGRIKHLINDNILKTEYLSFFVLDEADKLMEDSFVSDINEIYNALPTKKQIVTTSATYPNALEKHLSEYMVSPTFITAELETPLLLGLKQFVSVVDRPGDMCIQITEKTEELRRILSSVTYTQCMVFFNYQSLTESVTNILNRCGWQATFIHAGQSQPERLAAVNKFKLFQCRILTSTDLTARGIDAANVDLVINFDIPSDAMTYLHRMGRAGRYGSTGACINITLKSELEVLQKILGSIGGSGITIPKLPEFAGSIQDLLKIEVAPENCLNGIVSDTPTGDIRKRINELKKGKQAENPNKKTATKTTKKVKKEPQNSSDAIKTLDPVKKPVSQMDNNAILESLAKGTFQFDAVAEPNGSLHSASETLITGETKKVEKKEKSNDESMKTVKKEVAEPNESLYSASTTLISRETKKVEKKQKSDDDPMKTVKKEGVSEMDNNAILASLASGTFQFDTIAQPSGSVSSISRTLLYDEPTVDVKNTRSPTSSSGSNEKCLKKQKLEETFCKNKALLDVTKILIYPDSIKSEETSLQACLDTLKLNEKEKVSKYSRKDIPELLDAIKSDCPALDEDETEESDRIENEAHSSGETENVDVERIFEVAYNTIVKSAKDNLEGWLEKLEKKTANRENVNGSVSMLVNDGLSEDNEDSDAPVEIMKWVPVKPGKNDQSRSRQMSNAEQDTTLWVINQNHDIQEDEGSESNLDGDGAENEQYDCNDEVEVRRWVPVDESANQQQHRQYAMRTAQTDVERYDHFQRYFQGCSESLWHNGLRFADLASFDEWFYYEWEAQLYAVRNYVQQNIYLDEMDKSRNFNG